MAVLNKNLITKTLASTKVEDNGDTVSVVTLVLHDDSVVSIVSRHQYEGRETKTKREHIGLPSGVDVTCKSLVTWESPRTLTEVVKVFVGGEVDVSVVSVLL